MQQDTEDSDWLVIAVSHAFLCCVKRSTSESVTMDVHKEGKRAFAPLQIWSKSKNVWKNSSLISINLFNSCNGKLFVCMTHCTRSKFVVLVS